MINALVLLNLNAEDRGDTKEKIGSKGLGNAKQLILNSWPIQDEVVINLAVDGTGEVLNVALADLAEIPGIKGVSVVHIRSC